MVGNNRGGKYLVADLNDNASMPYLRAVSVLRVYHEVQMILHVLCSGVSQHQTPDLDLVQVFWAQRQCLSDSFLGQAAR